jgi:hypothetical protein
MTAGQGDQVDRLRAYKILMLTAMAWFALRVLLVCAVDQQTPFLSANDRSRWCTVRSLVELGTYRIDDVISQPGWNTIDKVSHAGRDGQQHYYSSKPPLLATIVSTLYWPIHRLGLNFNDRPFLVGRLLLLIFNGALLAIWLLVCLAIIEQRGSTDWGRVFAAAVACWATFLTTFAVTLNNHLPAAVGVAVATMGLLGIWCDSRRECWLFVLVGLAAALAAANELPCVSFLAIAATACMFKSVRLTLVAFLPAVFLVAAGFFATNKIAHDSWIPPYAHRAVGEDWRGDNWYNYPGSYWLPENRKGVDQGEPSRVKYALHTSIGHHGVLSLTPVWLLSCVGVWLLVQREQRRWTAFTIVVLTIVCWLFYVFRPLADRNYAGLCCGFRWMFWLIPLWIVALIPAVDAIADQSKWRRVAWWLFAVSLFSALYGSLHPWMHPWPYAILQLVTSR